MSCFASILTASIGRSSGPVALSIPIFPSCSDTSFSLNMSIGPSVAKPLSICFLEFSVLRVIPQNMSAIFHDVCFDSDFVANKCNRYFCNIAEKLVDKLPLRTYREDRVQDYYKEKGIERNSFKFNVVEQLEVENMLRSLGISKSAGEDKISGQFLGDAAEVISSPLTYIMNLSLKSATVPDDFKLARVLPIYKKGNRNYEGNYRPVSILPVASKVLEKIVYNQMHNYLEQNHLIYAFQSGFRSAHSTDTALTFLADKLRANIDEGLYTGMVLIDLQKSFDYTILTTKLNAIGIDDSAGSWFKSYLAGRKQVVKINGRLSTAGNITCGVPEGSILGRCSSTYMSMT